MVRNEVLSCRCKSGESEDFKYFKLVDDLDYVPRKALRLSKMRSRSLLESKLNKLDKGNGITIVQIGACDGIINDPIYPLVRSDLDVSQILLVEPQSHLIPILKRNYEFHKNAKIENVAIGKRGTIKMFRLKECYWPILHRTYLLDSPLYRVPSGFVSESYNHVYKHLEGRLSNQVEVSEAIEEFVVPSVPLADLVKLHQIGHIHLIQVDCEGFDDEVIYHCDLSSLKPNLIHFEHMHLKSAQKIALYDFLKSIGYTINEYSETDSLAQLRRQYLGPVKSRELFKDLKQLLTPGNFLNKKKSY